MTTSGVEAPNPHDVLCFNGDVKHRGNKRYRSLVDFNKDVYDDSNDRQKTVLAITIVQAVREQKGRFLQLDTSSNLWFELDDAEASARTGQALAGDRSIEDPLPQGAATYSIGASEGKRKFADNESEATGKDDGSAASCTSSAARAGVRRKRCRRSHSTQNTPLTSSRIVGEPIHLQEHPHTFPTIERPVASYSDDRFPNAPPLFASEERKKPMETIAVASPRKETTNKPQKRKTAKARNRAADEVQPQGNEPEEVRTERADSTHAKENEAEMPRGERNESLPVEQNEPSKEFVQNDPLPANSEPNYDDANSVLNSFRDSFEDNSITRGGGSSIAPMFTGSSNFGAVGRDRDRYPFTRGMVDGRRGRMAQEDDLRDEYGSRGRDDNSVARRSPSRFPVDEDRRSSSYNSRILEDERVRDCRMEEEEEDLPRYHGRSRRPAYRDDDYLRGDPAYGERRYSDGRMSRDRLRFRDDTPRMLRRSPVYDDEVRGRRHFSFDSYDRDFPRRHYREGVHADDMPVRSLTGRNPSANGRNQSHGVILHRQARPGKSYGPDGHLPGDRFSDKESRRMETSRLTRRRQEDLEDRVDFDSIAPPRPYGQKLQSGNRSISPPDEGWENETRRRDSSGRVYYTEDVPQTRTEQMSDDSRQRQFNEGGGAMAREQSCAIPKRGDGSYDDTGDGTRGGGARTSDSSRGRAHSPRSSSDNRRERPRRYADQQGYSSQPQYGRRRGRGGDLSTPDLNHANGGLAQPNLPLGEGLSDIDCNGSFDTNSMAVGDTGLSIETNSPMNQQGALALPLGHATRQRDEIERKNAADRKR